MKIVNYYSLFFIRVLRPYRLQLADPMPNPGRPDNNAVVATCAGDREIRVLGFGSLRARLEAQQSPAPLTHGHGNYSYCRSVPQTRLKFPQTSGSWRFVSNVGLSARDETVLPSVKTCALPRSDSEFEASKEKESSSIRKSITAEVHDWEHQARRFSPCAASYAATYLVFFNVPFSPHLFIPAGTTSMPARGCEQRTPGNTAVKKETTTHLNTHYFDCLTF